MKALIIVDPIVQFFTGEWANKRAQAIVPNLVTLVMGTKHRNEPVIIARDAHSPKDPELKIWGQHAMAGTPGAEIIPELQGFADIEVPKNTYDAFNGTSLSTILLSKGVTEVVIAGVLTDICVRHTAASAFMHGHKITIYESCVDVLDTPDAKEVQKYELEKMHKLYGAKIIYKWMQHR